MGALVLGTLILGILVTASMQVGALIQTDCTITDDCIPTPGAGYPTSCPVANKAVVCERGQVNTEAQHVPMYQKETGLAAVANGCDVTMCGIWMGEDHPFPGPLPRPHLATTLSCDGGQHWYAPGTPTTECPTPDPNEQKFFNGSFFSELLPEDCDGYSINPETWTSLDPEVAAGGNGAFYLVGMDNLDYFEAPINSLLFTRTYDNGHTFGPFEQGRRLKHICMADAYNPDRCGVAANPNLGSDQLFVYWNNSHLEIRLVRSEDAGETFLGHPLNSEPVLLDDRRNASGQEDPLIQLYAPEGVVGADGKLYVVWTEATLAGPQTRILMRRRDGAGWFPTLDPLEYNEPHPVTDYFNGWNFYGYPGFAPRSAPSVAVDRSNGPYHGWVYVVYADRGDPTDPQNPEPSRVKFVRSCNNGEDWSDPCAISPDAEPGHENSAQVFPRIRVDGRGNIGVSWYDTRFDDGQGDGTKYDIFFAYSVDGGMVWEEKRVTPPEGGLPMFQTTSEGVSDYSAMAADPRPGESKFYLLTMGAPRDEVPPDQDIYSFEITLRAAGDWNGDYGIDLIDSWFLINVCFTGPQIPPENCRCLVFDFDDDGDVDLDDVIAFWDNETFTGKRCDCAEECQLRPDCLDGGGAALESGPSSASLGTVGLPEGCEGVFPFIEKAPLDTVSSFVTTLHAYLKERPDAPDRAKVERYLACLEAVLP